MKKLNLVLVLMLGSFVFLSSCDKDDELNANEVLANVQNATENRIIPVAELEKNIVVVGATSKSGSAPVPIGSVDFKLTGNNDRAQLKSGLNIKLESSDDNIAGAYIQLLDANKNKVDGYFEVPKSAFTYGRLKGEESKSIFGLRTKELDENEIDINFEDGLQPGTFCYEICLYDEDSNVSVIQEVCVEVESWGGNANLVGTWKFNEAESDIDEFDDDYYGNCSNGDSVLIEENGSIDLLTLTFNSNGLYTDEIKETYQESNFDFFECNVTYEEDKDHESAEGNWSYDEDDQTLMVVSFKDTDFIDPEESEEYEDGELYFEDAKVSISGNKLTLTFTYDEDDEEEIFIYVFDRQ